MSEFRARIEELRARARARPAGVLACAQPDQDWTSNGVQLGSDEPLTLDGASAATSQRLSDDDLAKQLGGRRMAEGLIVVERAVPLGARHGQRLLGEGLAESLASFGHVAGNAVFLDTETTGLAGGVGTMVFLVGLARVTESAVEVGQYFLSAFAGEVELLRAAHAFVSDSTTVVTYNGKSFDIPLLTTRYRLAGLDDPFQNLTHIDLLYPTRGLFRKRWPDCRLPTAEERLLRLRRGDDLPGAEAPQAWLDWIRFSRWRELPRVLRHNALDVASLVTLVPALSAARQAIAS